jgi:hypothetical protein
MLLHKVSHKSCYVLGLVLLLISISQQQAPIIVKAQNSGWPTPETIPGYDPETWSPILVADRDRTIHAFSSQSVDVGEGVPVSAIFYNRWTLEQGWTLPTDIILSPSKDARITDAHLDSNGVFHVVFYGGDNTGADIYYSKAPAASAADADAWSTPIIIGENAGEPEGAVFFEGDPRTLSVIYNGRKPLEGLYIVNSKDGGESWSDPSPIFLATSDEPFISQLHVIKTKSGWLHAIWLVSAKSGQGREIYYARSKDGSEWTEPVLLTEAKEGLGPQAPAIVEYDDSLLAVYIMTPKIRMQRSSDDGRTWDDPQTIFPRHVGANGSLSLLVDSEPNLHLFFGQRITGNPDMHGMWHSIYKNGRWLEPEAVVKGPLVLDKIGSNGFDPFEAHGVIVQGNVILITWITERSSKGNGVWFSYKLLDSKEIPAIPVPLTIPQENSNPNTRISITSRPSNSPGSLFVDNVNTNSLPTANTDGLRASDILAISGISSFVCIVIVIILQQRSRK